MSMTVQVIVCRCGHRLLNVADLGNANRRDILAQKKLARKLCCEFGKRLTHCPRCGHDLKIAKNTSFDGNTEAGRDAERAPKPLHRLSASSRNSGSTSRRACQT